MSSIIDIAIRRLSERSSTEHELRTYLEEEFAAMPELNSHIDSALKQLKEMHLMSDLRLATNLAQHYTHKGNRFISQVLRQKGIAEDVITDVLSSLDNENDRALDVARKKLDVHGDSSEKALALLHRFLSGRSFSYTAINAVMGQLSNQNRYSF